MACDAGACKFGPGSVWFVAQVERQVADRVLDLAALFVGQRQVQVRVREGRGKFDGSEKVLDGFVGIA